MNAIVMLHAVDHSDSVLSIAPEDLESLIDSIRSAGHEIVPLLDLLAGPGTDRRVALTFDDGLASVANAAAEVLAAKTVQATLFLTTGHVDADNGWPSQPDDVTRVPMMGWEQVRELADSGWAIEAHTVHHSDLRNLDDEELERELREPLDEIERRCGRRPSVLAYPYGYFDDRVVDRARSLYRFAVTTCLEALSADRFDPMRAPRLDAYYFRAPRIHRRFGRADFRAYIGLRRALRRVRSHPGEIA